MRLCLRCRTHKPNINWRQHFKYAIWRTSIFVNCWKIVWIKNRELWLFHPNHIGKYEPHLLCDVQLTVFFKCLLPFRFSWLPPSDLSEQVLSPPAKQYSSMMAYNNVKLCNVLFARGLAKVNSIDSRKK